MAQLKQKANTKRGSRLESIFCHREKPASGSTAEQMHRNMSVCQSETGILTAVEQSSQQSKLSHVYAILEWYCKDLLYYIIRFFYCHEVSSLFKLNN